MKQRRIIYILLLGAGCLPAQRSAAQLKLPVAGYFQNQYLLNPAMSGLEAGKGSAGAAYSRQGDIKDAPTTLYFDADYGFSNHVGAGINLLRDHAGLLTTNKLMATYSYHINLGDNKQRLHFGISAGGVQHRLDYQGITGDLNDPSLYNYNQDNSMKFEADAGVAYTDDKLNLQAAFPNIIANARKEPGTVINRVTFFGAASYKWKPADNTAGVSIEPKVAYRMVKGNDDILDAGVNVGFLGDVVNVYGLYHTSRNMTAGFNLRLFGQLEILAGYTTQTKELKSNANGDLSFGLRFSF